MRLTAKATGDKTRSYGFGTLGSPSYLSLRCVSRNLSGERHPITPKPRDEHFVSLNLKGKVSPVSSLSTWANFVWQNNVLNMQALSRCNLVPQKRT